MFKNIFGGQRGLVSLGAFKLLSSWKALLMQCAGEFTVVIGSAVDTGN
jgi:hypothetical protein